MFLTVLKDHGSIHASTVLYERMFHYSVPTMTYANLSHIGLLETILFANIRFHDTVSRGRVLNRFGKDFEGLWITIY